MNWQTLKPHSYNLCLHEVVEGNPVHLVWTRTASKIIHGGKPKYHFDGPEAYKSIIKNGFAMLDKMNSGKMDAKEIHVRLMESDDEKYLLPKGTPFLQGITVKNSAGQEGRVDPVGRSLLSEDMGFIELAPVALPACFMLALDNDEFERCQSILDTLSSIPSLFGKFGFNPKYKIKLTTDNGEDLSWDITTLQGVPLQIITT